MPETETGLVERLRAFARAANDECNVNYADAMGEAADAIERLEREKRELERPIFGWREYDWPEGFDRRTAQLIADNVRDHMERLKR